MSTETLKNNKESNETKFSTTEIIITILTVLVASLGVIYFSISEKPSLALSGAIVAIICALTGVWITTLVTRLLLDKQTKLQAKLQEKQVESQAKLQNNQNVAQNNFQKELQEMQLKIETEREFNNLSSV